MRGWFVRIFGALIFVVVVVLGGLSLYHLYQLHDEPPFAVTHARMYELIERVQVAYKSSQRGRPRRGNNSMSGCKLARQTVLPTPVDGWSSQIAFSSIDSCRAGGCLYELRSPGNDSKIQTSDDMVYRRLVGDCSGQDFSHARFRDVDAVGVRLVDASFKKTRIKGMRFKNANLEGASFHNARVDCASRDAGLECLEFNESNVSRVDFGDVKAERLGFSGGVVHDINLGGATLGEMGLVNTAALVIGLSDATIGAIKCAAGESVEISRQSASRDEIQCLSEPRERTHSAPH